MKLEGTAEGYYVVFDHRQNPEPKVETETINGGKIRSYVIPVIQASLHQFKRNAAITRNTLNHF